MQFDRSVIFSKFYFKGTEVPVSNISVRMADIEYNVSYIN